MEPRKLLNKNKHLLIVMALFAVALLLIILYVGGYIGRIPKTAPEEDKDALEEVMKTLNAPENGPKETIPKEVIDSLTAPEKSPDNGSTDALSSPVQEQKNQEVIDSMSAPKK